VRNRVPRYLHRRAAAHLGRYGAGARASLVAVVILLTILGVRPVYADDETISAAQVCSSNDSAFVGPCFSVHARLQPGADNVVVYIWPVGTRRLLGYLGYPDLGYGHRACDYPDVLTQHLMAGQTIYADVVVRPVSPSLPGHMQFVCIAEATNLVVRANPL
jgi:hypothetical protein